MKQAFVREEPFDPYEGKYFIVMCLIHLGRENSFKRFFIETHTLNEKNLLNEFRKRNKEIVNEIISIVSITKLTYEEFYEFSFEEFAKLFPQNLKVFHFKTNNDKIFIRRKMINNEDHEFFYLKKMESQGFKCIGKEPYIYRHKLYKK